MAEVGAEEALAVARGEEAPQTGRSSGSEDSDDDSSGSESWVGRLWDGSAPGPSMGELRVEYDELPRWALLGLRGILRTASGDGVPPIAELALAGILWFLQAGESSSSSSEDNSDGETDAIDVVDATA